MIEITPSIRIDDSAIEEQFVRSPGPGGQNVNKTATAVQLRFDAKANPAISDAVFRRLKVLAGRRMTRDGVIVITANRFRSQDRNRRDALDRLVALIRDAAIPPKVRRRTRPPKGARESRLAGKRHQGEIKRGRSKVIDD